MVNRGTEEHPYYVWTEPRIVDTTPSKEERRQRRERYAFRDLSVAERRAYLAKVAPLVEYRQYPAHLRSDAHAHGVPSHHVGPCDRECRRGIRPHKHRRGKSRGGQ